MQLNPLQRRRLANFKANRRAFWSFWIFLVIFTVTLFAEFVANDKPLAVWYQGELRSPVLSFYSEADFGGEFETEAEYHSPEVRCLIRTGGLDACLDDPEGVYAQAEETGAVDGTPVAAPGWAVWPLVPYSFDTINYDVASAPSPPDRLHWLGTDDQTRDVVARVIYGFRISVLFALIVAVISSAIGIAAGATQGYFGGAVDLVFQRLVEIDRKSVV